MRRAGPITRYRVRHGGTKTTVYDREGNVVRVYANRADHTRGPRWGVWPRWVHRWYAHRHGFFWIPCPICGEEFGGHEWGAYLGHELTIPKPFSPGTGIGICPWCTIEKRGWSV